MCGCMNKSTGQTGVKEFKVEGQDCVYTLEQLASFVPKADLMDEKYPSFSAGVVLATQINEYDQDCNKFAKWIKDNIENFTNEL